MLSEVKPALKPDGTDTEFSVDGKRVLITGGTAGIGLGLARHFTCAGAKVVITGRRADGSAIADQVGANFVEMDVVDVPGCGASVEAAAADLGGAIDVLILNAGVDFSHGRIDDLDVAAFRATFEVNFFGVANVMRHAVAYLFEGSSVIVSSSPASTTYKSGLAAYSASKAAVNALVKSWAGELAAKGVRVNAVLPGIVESEMSGSTGGAEFIQALTLTDTIRNASELGGVYQFLASSASAPVTAALIAADDGLSAGMSDRLERIVAEAVLTPASKHTE